MRRVPLHMLGHCAIRTTSCNSLIIITSLQLFAPLDISAISNTNYQLSSALFSSQDRGFETLPQILRVLKAEQYGTEQINGPALHKQLKALIENAKGKPSY
jgi:hypothetical protein